MEADEFISRENIVCEQCQHVNIVQIKHMDMRKKDRHVVFCDAPTWILIKTEAAAAGATIGQFLSQIIGFYRAHRQNFAVPEVEV